MVDICIAFEYENDTLGWSTRLVRQGDSEPDEPFRNTEDVISRSRSTDLSQIKVLYKITACVKTSESLRLWLRNSEWEDSQDDLDGLRQQLRQKGHETVEILFVSDQHEKKIGYDVEALSDDLRREARAACWGVSLNEYAFIPGLPVESKKAQKLHIIAKKSGFTPGALRLFLSEYGMISTKEVTNAIYDRVRRRLQSNSIADLYNQKYDEQRK